MEKRRLISLRSVLLQYLVRTALACLLVAVGWLLVLLLWIQNSGLFLPANQAAQACQKAAQDVLPASALLEQAESTLSSITAASRSARSFFIWELPLFENVLKEIEKATDIRSRSL